MTVPSCVRCGQLLLPEIVRELGEGRRCPFCGAELKSDAKVAIKNTAPAGRPPPPAPAARPKTSAAAPTLPGMSAVRAQTAAAAVAVAPSAAPVAPSPARAHTMPTMAFARAPEPDLAPNVPSLPAPRPQAAEPVVEQRLGLAPPSPGAGPPWLAAVRKRPWLVALAALAVIGTIALASGRRPTATTRKSPALPTGAAPPASVELLKVSPPPPLADHEDVEDPGRATAGSPAATRHVKKGARSHAGHRIHHQKKRAAHPSRSDHQRVLALANVAAPKGSEDERSARASYERGNQRLLTGDTTAAIAAYEEAVRSAPTSPSGYRGLGLAYEKEGKVPEAVRAFRRYLELAPSSGDRDLVAGRLRHLRRSGADRGK